MAAPQGVEVHAGERVEFQFQVPAAGEGEFAGFGGWFCAPDDAKVSISPLDGAPQRKVTLQPGDAPSWSKAGSMWRGPSEAAAYVLTVEAPAQRPCLVWYYGMGAGRIEHEHLSAARENLLGNMHKFSPEAHFYVPSEADPERPNGTVLVAFNTQLSGQGTVVPPNGEPPPLYLKACNRCGRFLPINYPNERHHLSFTNHCSAPHRRPCKHSNFGLLKNVEPEAGEPDELDLEYGYQLECRFCKKFEVNAAHNPKRTAAQMKEDGARRRNFEVLLKELYGASDSLRYRERTGRELVDDVYRAFGQECFNCGAALPTPKSMHLDHTRPLALLWPLDGTATALCASCNSSKRDRPPVEFYTREQLESLAAITGLSLDELLDPSPNQEAIGLLADRLDWFFDEFLQRRDLVKERDGKTAADLVLKALDKAIRSGDGPPVLDILAEARRRGYRE